MKAIAYSIKSQEKESLILANGKKHALTMVSNALDEQTLIFAEEKDVVMVSSVDVLEPSRLTKLCAFGVRFLVIRCADPNHQVDLTEAKALGFTIAQVSCDILDLEDRSKAIIAFLDTWHAEGGAKCSGQCSQRTCQSKSVEYFPPASTCAKH